MTRFVKGGDVSTIPAINTKLEEIEVAINDTLSRKGDVPNQLETDVDLNNYRILNVPKPVTSTDVARLQDVALAAQTLGTTSIVRETTGRGIDVIAHRGFRDSFPQNTMLAFSSAIRRGATSLETDMQITSDGQVVLYHDNTLDTLTNGTGAVKDNTLSVVQSAIIDETAGTIYAETRIPTLGAFLTYTSSIDVDIWVEIKKYRTQSDISLMVADIVLKGMETRANISSFNISDVQAARGYSANIGVGLLGSSQVQSTYEAAVDAVKALGGSGYIIWNYTSLLSTPAIVAYAHLNGVEVAAYTVDDNTAAKALMSLGVKKIITDIPLVVK